MTTFESLGLTEPVLKALKAEGYAVPTPIQAKAVPHVLAGRDLFGCAQTGTGKTAAFALPLIERMMANPRERTARRCRVLVLAPTRELAGQIHESFRVYGSNAHLKSAVIYGGVGQRPQETAMSKGVDVLVATPGRLLDLVQQKFVDLRAVEFLVLDEADRMLDMGFIHDVRRIVGMLPRERQTLFFSATLPSEVRQLADSMLRDPLEVKTTPQSTPAETVAQSVFFLAQRQKRHRSGEGSGGGGGQGGSSRGRGGRGGRSDGRRSSGGQQQRQGAQASGRPRSSEPSQGESRSGGTATAAAPAAPAVRKIKKHRRAL